MKIAPITNYNNYHADTREFPSQQPTFVETSDSVSFKSAKRVKIGSLKKLLNTLTTAIASTTGIQIAANSLNNEEKSKQDANKILEDRFFMSYNRYAEIVEREIIERCLNKNPQMLLRLYNKKFVDQQNIHQHCYSHIEIESIIDYNSKNPELASKLEEVLASYEPNEHLRSRKDIDYLAKKIQEEPETVEKFKSESSPRTYCYLKAYEIDPEFTEKVHKIKDGISQSARFGALQILDLIELHKKYPRPVEALATFKDHCEERNLVFTLGAIRKLAPKVDPTFSTISDYVYRRDKLNDYYALGLAPYYDINEKVTYICRGL